MTRLNALVNRSNSCFGARLCYLAAIYSVVHLRNFLLGDASKSNSIWEFKNCQN
jgi:hypothetical protein